MITLNELAIHRARLLRDLEQHPTETRRDLRVLDNKIVAQNAVSVDDAVVKLELALELARHEGEGSDRVARLIDDALHALRH